MKLDHPLEKSGTRLAYLEGIRGIAAFVVLITHFKNIVAIDLEARTQLFFAGLVHNDFLARCLNTLIVFVLDGKLAVFIFWFMSGYVISIRLFGPGGMDYLKAAALKRYFRLAIPVLASVLFAYILMKAHLMYNVQLADRSGPEFHTMKGVFNFEPGLAEAFKNALFDSFFQFHYRGSYNPILWTMSPELYGSFICFGLFWIFRTRPGRYLVFIGMMIAALWSGLFWMVTFLLGYMLSDIAHSENPFRERVEAIFGKLFSNSVLIFFWALVLIIINGIFLTYYAGYAKVLVSTGLVTLVMYSDGLKHFFSRGLLRWLGKISFSLYLVHLPLIYSLSCYLYMTLPLGFTGNILVSGSVTILAALLLSMLFTRFIDRPAIRFSDAWAIYVLKLFKGNKGGPSIPAA